MRSLSFIPRLWMEEVPSGEKKGQARKIYRNGKKKGGKSPLKY
jgi:hypothetical protein